MDRRAFLQRAGIITAGGLLLPSFLRANMLNKSLQDSKKRLVIIQLSGGNDGLNTVIPYGLDAYYQNRSAIGIDKLQMHKLNDQFGLHSSLTGMFKLHQEGKMSILNSVGYPNPNRSHFRSMDIWQTASDSNHYEQTGWLGRYLDNHCDNAYNGIELNGNLSLALKGYNKSGIALTHPKAFYDTIHSEFYDQLKPPTETNNTELDFMYKCFSDTKDSAKYILDQYKSKKNTTEYKKGKLGQNLKKIATLIKSDIQTPVFYTSLGGFDTHVNQLNNHERLLTELDNGVSSFVADLEKDNLLKDTTILIFSEFGRRLKENASRGTDHGAANVTFLIDTNFSNAAHNYNTIDLSNLDNGDPIYKVDFRSIYQEVINHRLNGNAEKILKKQYTPLQLFK